MAEAEVYRRIAAALEEIELWRVIAPLLPFAVHRDHAAERKAEKAALLARIPQQRRPISVWPVATPPRPRIQPRRLQ